MMFMAYKIPFSRHFPVTSSNLQLPSHQSVRLVFGQSLHSGEITPFPHEMTSKVILKEFNQKLLDIRKITATVKQFQKVGKSWKMVFETGSTSTIRDLWVAVGQFYEKGKNKQDL